MEDDLVTLKYRTYEGNSNTLEKEKDKQNGDADT